jgi:hypothetical protein
MTKITFDMQFHGAIQVRIKMIRCMHNMQNNVHANIHVIVGRQFNLDCKCLFFSRADEGMTFYLKTKSYLRS